MSEQKEYKARYDNSFKWVVVIVAILIVLNIAQNSNDEPTRPLYTDEEKYQKELDGFLEWKDKNGTGWDNN